MLENRSTDERVPTDRQAEAAPNRAGTPPRPAQALQEARHGLRCVDLDHVVQIPHVDPELERAGRDDHAVVCLGEGPLGVASLLEAQGRVRHEGLDLALAQKESELFHPCAAIAEHEALATAM